MHLSSRFASDESFAFAEVSLGDNDSRGSRSLMNQSRAFNISKVAKKIKRFLKGESFVYEVGHIELPRGGIGFINGINNDFEEAQSYALRLSEYGGGVKISHVYNATHSILVDVAECALGYYGIETPPIQILQDQWEDFVAMHEPEEKFLQICHSQGALHVKNALLAVTESIRKRIKVLAIAPAAIIPRELCCESWNYASMDDFVSLFDIEGMDLYADQLILLDRHADASLWDHDFCSPTYQEVIEKCVMQYINSCKS